MRWTHGGRGVLPVWVVEIEGDNEADVLQAGADWMYDVKDDVITVVATRISYTADNTTILAIAYETADGQPVPVDPGESNHAPPTLNTP